MTAVERVLLQRAEEQAQAARLDTDDPQISFLPAAPNMRRLVCKCGCGWAYVPVGRVGAPPQYLTDECRQRVRCARRAARGWR